MNEAKYDGPDLVIAKFLEAVETPNRMTNPKFSCEVSAESSRIFCTRWTSVQTKSTTQSSLEMRCRYPRAKDRDYPRIARGVSIFSVEHYYLHITIKWAC